LSDSTGSNHTDSTTDPVTLTHQVNANGIETELLNNEENDVKFTTH